MLIFVKERTGSNSYDHDGLTLKYKLDNEFDLVFVVAYQKILQLSYVDKFLNDIHLAFRDKYKNELSDGRYFQQFDFIDRYNVTLQSAEHWGKQQAKAPKAMRTFEESTKSKKTVASMIERKWEEKSVKKEKEKKKEVNFVEEGIAALILFIIVALIICVFSAPKSPVAASPKPSPKVGNGVVDDEIVAANRLKFAQKMSKKKPDSK